MLHVGTELHECCHLDSGGSLAVETTCFLILTPKLYSSFEVSIINMMSHVIQSYVE